jgi:hypothetical protein
VIAIVLFPCFSRVLPQFYSIQLYQSTSAADQLFIGWYMPVAALAAPNLMPVGLIPSNAE